MRVNYLCYSLFIIFLALSSIHFYWAFIGDWGLEQAIPTNIDGSPVLAPTTFDSAVVGSALLFFALSYWFLTTQVIKTPRWFNKIVGWLVPIIFLLRAIGDFKYVGFFKEIGTTSFAYADSLFYSPLCLLISVSGFVVLKKKIS